MSEICLLCENIQKFSDALTAREKLRYEKTLVVARRRYAKKAMEKRIAKGRGPLGNKILLFLPGIAYFRVQRLFNKLHLPYPSVYPSGTLRFFKFRPLTPSVFSSGFWGFGRDFSKSRINSCPKMCSADYFLKLSIIRFY